MKAEQRLLTITLAGTLLVGAACADSPPQVIDPPLTQFAWLGRPVTLKVSNLTEYAQGLDPRVTDREPWLCGRFIDDGGQTRFAVECRRRPLGHAVAYDVQVLGDLKTWRPFEATAAEALDPDGMLITTLTEAGTDPNAGTRFVRVNVRRAHPGSINQLPFTDRIVPAP